MHNLSYSAPSASLTRFEWDLAPSVVLCTYQMAHSCEPDPWRLTAFVVETCHGVLDDGRPSGRLSIQSGDEYFASTSLLTRAFPELGGPPMHVEAWYKVWGSPTQYFVTMAKVTPSVRLVRGARGFRLAA